MPEPEFMEGAKNYRARKVLPVIREMKDRMLGIYLAYIKIKEKLDQVQYRYDRLKESNEYLVGERKRLLEENGKLREENKNFLIIKRAIGDEKIGEIVKEKQEMEKLYMVSITRSVQIPEQGR